MPNARRVIFSSYVVPTLSLEMEETSVRHAEFMSSTTIDTLGKTLGGKGIATINATQWNDGWTSMFHSQVNWEDLDDATDTTGNRWEDSFGMWSGLLNIGDGMSGVQLTADTTDLAFLYIKNLGDTNNCLVSLNGTGGNYYIIIPPNGSVHLRGDGTDLECNEVYVKSSSSTTDIEYIIAQE